jgi:hypothetical protein
MIVYDSIYDDNTYEYQYVPIIFPRTYIKYVRSAPLQEWEPERGGAQFYRSVESGAGAHFALRCASLLRSRAESAEH